MQFVQGGAAATGAARSTAPAMKEARSGRDIGGLSLEFMRDRSGDLIRLAGPVVTSSAPIPRPYHRHGDRNGERTTCSPGGVSKRTSKCRSESAARRAGNRSPRCSRRISALSHLAQEPRDLPRRQRGDGARTVGGICRRTLGCVVSRHRPAVAATVGADRAVLCLSIEVRKSSTRQTPSRVCTAAYAKPCVCAAISRVTRPHPNCCSWSCVSSARTGRWLRANGMPQRHSSQSCSATASPQSEVQHRTLTQNS